MADRIYVTYTPTRGPESFHTAIHYERADSTGNVIRHDIIEAGPENRELSVSAKAMGVVEEALRTDNGPSRFGRIQAKVRNGRARDAGKHPSSDPDAPYEVIAEGDDLSGHLARMQLYAQGVNRAGLAYRGHRQNSNTFAGAALRAGDLPGPSGVARDPAGPAGELIEFFTPGLNEPWQPPIGPATSDRPDAVGDFRDDGNENLKLQESGGTGDRLVPSMLESRKSQEPPSPVRRVGRRIADGSLDDRFGNWTLTNGGFTPRNPNLAVPPAEPGLAPGINNGKPMPHWITPPPDPDMSHRSGQPGGGNGSMLPAGVFGDGGISSASMFVRREPAAPLVPVDKPDSKGGLAGRIAALAGVDPDNPDHPVPQPGGLLGLYLRSRR